MKKGIILLFLSMICILTGCTNAERKRIDTSELPVIVFLVRTDISDLLNEEEIARQNIRVLSLGFYDRDGNYYTSADPKLNAMDNETLIAEYEAGHLTEQIHYHTSCDAKVLSEQYAKLRKNCLKKSVEIVFPEHLPAVQAESSIWYGYYYDQNKTLQYQAIHQRKRMASLYTDNDTVNEIYDWIMETFKSTSQSE